MNTLKFRAWIPDAEFKENDMFYQEDQYLSSFLQRIYSAFTVNHPSHLNFDIEDRLMLFTNKLDRNGRDIYVKDIVKQTYMNFLPQHFGEELKIEEEIVIGEVIISNGCYMINDKKRETLFEIMSHCEVIGNIYANPEPKGDE